MQSNTEYLKDLAAKFKQEIKDCDWDNLCPPYLPKTVTHLRSKYFHEAK